MVLEPQHGGGPNGHPRGDGGGAVLPAPAGGTGAARSAIPEQGTTQAALTVRPATSVQPGLRWPVLAHDAGARRTGSLAGGAGLRPGDHACWTYRSDGRRREVLGAYVADGMAARERLLLLVAHGRERDVLDDVAAAGHPVDLLLGGGQLSVGVVQDAHAPGGLLDPDAGIATYQELVAQAMADGFTGLRVFRDVAPLLADPDVRARWPLLELRADLLVARSPTVVLCGYDLRVLDHAAVELPAAVHPLRLGGGDAWTPGFRLCGTADGAVALSGEVDLVSSEALAALLSGSAGYLGAPIVDVSDLAFVDVAGMRAIMAAARALSAAAGAAEVRGGSPLFRRVWSILGYDALEGVRLT